MNPERLFGGAILLTFSHTITRCTQTQPSGCILGASFDCINLPLNGDIVLQLLSYVAETERAFIRQRQAEGIAAAKARGQKFGRPRKERGENYERLLEKWRAGEISANQAGKQLGVSHKSFLRWARENEKKSS